MESVSRTFKQFLELYEFMSPSQRGTLIVVPLFIVTAFGVVMFGGSSNSHVALSWGKVFESTDLINAEQTLTEAGLSDYRREGQRIMVPKNQVDRYNAALIADGTFPSDSASAWEKYFKEMSAFATGHQVELRKKAALQEALRRVIRSVPDIDDADVIWAKGARRFGKPAKVTATVNVRPNRGHELTLSLIHSLRAAVAGMIPDLSPNDVTIFDQSTGISRTADESGFFGTKLVTQIQEFEQLHDKHITATLRHIDDVLVTVSIDLDNLQRHVERKTEIDKKTVELQTTTRTKDTTLTQNQPGQNANTPAKLNSLGSQINSQSSTEQNMGTVSVPSPHTVSGKEYIGAIPKAVKVNVSIPDDYYRAIALKQGLAEGGADFQKHLKEIERQEIDKVKLELRTLLPNGSPPEAINVRTYFRIPKNITPPAGSWFDTITGGLGKWGSAIGLAIFTFLVLGMLNKSMAKTPFPEPTTSTDSFTKAVSEDEEETNKKTEKALSKRDQLQLTIRDNPGAAVAVLSKWIQAVR